MNILITGADGYIGVVLTDLLLTLGHTVTGLDTEFYHSDWFYPSNIKQPKLIRKDVRNIVMSDIKGYDAIVHLAELSNDPLGQTNPQVTFDINHRGTVRLAKKAKKAGVPRFIYFSSCSVYGASDDMADETSPVHPLTAYAKAKVLNELSLQQLADESFSPVIMRNATVFGLSPRLRFDLVVNNLTGLAWTTKVIKMESDGTPWRPLVHISDVANAVKCILNAPRNKIHNQIINIGDSSANYQIKDIAEALSQVLSNCAISLGKSGGDKRNYRVNFDKIHSLLPEFRCQKTVLDGVKELLRVFDDVKLNYATFDSRFYTRLKQIQYLRSTNRLDDQLYWK